MTDHFSLRKFTDSITPNNQDPSASILIFGSTPEACTYYSLLHSYDARIYLCMTKETFLRRLNTDPLIKLIFLFATDLTSDVRHALLAICGRSEPLHIATVRIVSLAKSDDGNAFEVAYGAFRIDASDEAGRVQLDTKQALVRALEALRAEPRLVISAE